jgi:aminopeptidase N
MLESVVNEDNFRKGVSDYLRRYQFGNTVTTDLWNAIQDTVGDMLNISEFMDTYTRQIGYPILQATVKGSSYVFTQKRFLTDYNTAKVQKNHRSITSGLFL